MDTRKWLAPAFFAAVLGAGYGLGEFHALTPGVANASPSPPKPVAVASAAGGGIENLFVNVAERTMPSVVNIFTTKNVRMRNRFGRVGPGPGNLNDFWEHFFEEPDGAYGQNQGDEPLTASRPMALGTGFVIEAKADGTGLILTNNHVINGADGVKVKFTESDQERESFAEIVGTDPELDIALLRVKTERRLQAVALGDSDQLKVGEWIAALGNPFGHGHSVSHGIVSAKERALAGGFGNYLQVDAPINPGNSGGPLVNMAGEVVGINNAIDARGPGIGFAIPINAVKTLLPELEKHGRVERGYIGVGLRQRETDGAPLVAQVVRNGPAALAGLRAGDLLLKIDGRAVKNTGDVVAAITAIPVGRMVNAEVQRAGAVVAVAVKVGQRPDMRQAIND